MMEKTPFVLLGLVSCLLLFREARATIVLFGNKTVSYPSIESSFTPPIPAEGILGEVNIAEPLDGCSVLDINATAKITLVVMMRGSCTFEHKIRNGQNAGFTGVIVFENRADSAGELVRMSGDGEGITTHALFVDREAGENLLSLEGSVYLLPGYEKKNWSVKWLVLSVSLIVIIIVSVLVAVLCCIRRLIVAAAEKEAYNEKLLYNNDHSSYTESEHNDLFQNEGQSDADGTPDLANHTGPN